MSFALPRIFSFGHNRGITPDVPPKKRKKGKKRKRNRCRNPIASSNIPPIVEENNSSLRKARMVDALGIDPWNSKKLGLNKNTSIQLAPIEPEENDEQWERRQLERLRQFAESAGTISTTESNHSIESTKDFTQHRMPRSKQLRIPTPVFRPLSGRLFPKYPAYVYQVPYVRGFQTLWRRYRHKKLLGKLREEKRYRDYIYSRATYLQKWAKRCLQIKGYFDSSAYWDAVRRALLAKLVPELALDFVVDVMQHANRQIIMISKSVAACSTIIIWYRQWTEIKKERARLRIMILEHKSSNIIRNAWKKSRLRIRLKNAIKNLALRYRSVVVIQRVVRGMFGRMKALLALHNKVTVCIQRRWFYYRSRIRFHQIKHNELNVLLRDLKGAESRLLTLLEEDETKIKQQQKRRGEGATDTNNIYSILQPDDCFFLLAWHGTTCNTSERNLQAYRKNLLRRYKLTNTNRYKKYDSRSLVIEHRGAGDDLLANSTKTKKSRKKNNMNISTEMLKTPEIVPSIEMKKKHSNIDSDDDAALGESMDKSMQTDEDHSYHSDDDLDEVESLDSNVDCRIINDVKIQFFLEKLLLQAIAIRDITMIRMAQALHYFSMGTINDLIKGRDIMTLVRKTDKQCLLFKQHDQRIHFIHKWMHCSPSLLNLKVEFDPIHLHHIQALRDWHCYRRYDLAEVHFQKAVHLARPSERPYTYSAIKCEHGKSWKLNVRRMFQSYRRFLGFHSARNVIETIGMVTTS
jgi:hypothetical protein